MKIVNVEFRNIGTVNQNRVTLVKEGGQRIVLYFSYETLVAIDFGKLYCLENYWSNTTGKFLNCIEPNHKDRISKEEFKKVLKDTFKDDDIDLLKDPVGSIENVKEFYGKKSE